jgi:uncharacterized protein
MSTHLHVKPDGTPTWTDLSTPDPEASRKFYHAVFGWEYDVGGPEFAGYTTARLGNRTTAGIAGLIPGMPPQPAGWGLYFASSNLEADVERAVKLGATVLMAPMTIGEFGGSATCLDPTGAQFSFWKGGLHVGSQVTEEPGSTTWQELYSPNAKQARDFYTALLHATADPMPGGLEYYTLMHGKKMLGGIMQIDPSWGNMPAQWVSYFTVANIDATVATVLKHGGKIMGNIDDSPFGRLAALADPHGATFKVLQPPTG